MVGNIVTSDNIKVDENFNVVDSLDKIIEGIPTLIIGIDNANKTNYKLNYLERKINETTYWTFNKKEKRDLFEEDLFYFIEHSYNKLTHSVEYFYVDFILFSSENIKKVINKIVNNDNNITFHYKEMVYVYCENYIFGFDLRQIKFANFNSDKFLNKIKDNSKVLLDDDKILIEYKNNLGMLEDEIKYIPLLYSIKENG